MNQSAPLHPYRTRPLSFVLASVSVVVLLVSLGIGARKFAGVMAVRNSGVTGHGRVLQCIEAYKNELKEYPAPANPDVTVTIDGVKFPVGGAMMIYQIVCGDGNDQIAASAAGGRPSDGLFENDVFSSFNIGLDWVNWKEVEGRRFAVDSYGHPYQYEKGGTPEALNPTYDCWSYGGDSATFGLRDAATKRDPVKTARWIKNFPYQAPAVIVESQTEGKEAPPQSKGSGKAAEPTSPPQSTPQTNARP